MAVTQHPAIYVVGAVAVWWIANTISTIASKSVMEGADFRIKDSGSLTTAFMDIRWLELTALQHLVGAVFAGICLKLSGKSIWPAGAHSHIKLILIAALGNVIGNSATNAAFSLIKSSTAQVIKACEPIFTVGLTLVLYKNNDNLNLSRSLSVVIIVLGACSFLMKDATISVWGLVAAVISNFAFPTRNIFLKKLSDIWDGPLQKFAIMSIYSHAFLLPVWLLKLVSISGLSINEFYSTLTSSIFHSTYNLASIAVLENVSPVTHAILNISKRLFVITASIIYFHTPITVVMLISIITLLVGCYLYQSNTFSSRKWLAIKCTIVTAFLCYMFVSYKTGRTAISKQLPQYRISTAWISFRPVPSSVVSNIHYVARQNPGSPMHVYCGSTQCVEAFSHLNNNQIIAEFAVIPDIVKGMPLEAWVPLHPLNKILAGASFEDHLQRVVVLGILWQFGGLYFNPKVRVTEQFRYIEGMGAWVSEGVGIENSDMKEVFDVAYFPKEHSFIAELAEVFISEYPIINKKGDEFKFNFLSKAWNLITYSSSTGPHILKNLRHKNLTLDPTTDRFRSHQFGALSFQSRVSNIRVANLGDEVQVFPGTQFLPYVDKFLDRDNIGAFKSDENVSLFFNAWWGSIKSFPPPSVVHPLPLSIHLNIHGLGASKSQAFADYMRKWEPVGCRDHSTMGFFTKANVKNFFSGCLTLFMSNPYPQIDRREHIYIVDLKKESLELLPPKIQADGIKIAHDMDDARNTDSPMRFNEAYNLMKKYAKAKVVITQRIHCALPSIAMGTPVIFFNSPGLPGGGGSGGKESDRVSGLTPLFHTVSLYSMNKKEAKQWLLHFNWDNPPSNPDAGMIMRLRATSWNVIRRDPILLDSGRKFGIIPMQQPKYSLKAEKFTFHLIFTTKIRTLSSGDMQYGSFNWRQWRCIESILYHHPTSEVIVHSNTLSQDTFDVLTEVGYNVKIQSYSLEELLHGSPAEEFLSKLEAASRGSFWHLHEAKLLCLLILYQKGGVFVNNDVILMRPIDMLTMNSVGYGDKLNHSINGAFMIFEKNNSFLRYALSTFTKYNSNDQTADGPDVLTVAWRDYKGDKDGIHVLPHYTFYLFDSSDMIKQCFEDTAGETFEASMNIIKKQAYGVYLNSTLTGHIGLGQDGLKENTISKYVLNTYCILCSDLH